MVLQAKDRRGEGGADEEELEDSVGLADEGRLHLGGGQRHVKVLLHAELQ